jgi:hypothetical protein
MSGLVGGLGGGGIKGSGWWRKYYPGGEVPDIKTNE